MQALAVEGAKGSFAWSQNPTAHRADGSPGPAEGRMLRDPKGAWREGG